LAVQELYDSVRPLLLQEKIMTDREAVASKSAVAVRPELMKALARKYNLHKEPNFWRENDTPLKLAMALVQHAERSARRRGSRSASPSLHGSARPGSRPGTSLAGIAELSEEDPLRGAGPSGGSTTFGGPGDRRSTIWLRMATQAKEEGGGSTRSVSPAGHSYGVGGSVSAAHLPAATAGRGFSGAASVGGGSHAASGAHVPVGGSRAPLQQAGGSGGSSVAERERDGAGAAPSFGVVAGGRGNARVGSSAHVAAAAASAAGTALRAGFGAVGDAAAAAAAVAAGGRRSPLGGGVSSGAGSAGSGEAVRGRLRRASASFRPYGGDLFAQRGEYSSALVYLSRLGAGGHAPGASGAAHAAAALGTGGGVSRPGLGFAPGAAASLSGYASLSGAQSSSAGSGYGGHGGGGSRGRGSGASVVSLADAAAGPLKPVTAASARS
jgi:hypothetical protein